MGLLASYDSWIMFQDIIIREARLIQLKIHTVDPNDDSRLSRKPAFDWLKLVDEDKKRDCPTLAKEIVATTDDDIRLLSNSVLEHIHYGMELAMGNKMHVGEAILKPGYFISHETRVDFETTQHIHPEEKEYCIDESADVVNRRIPRLSTTREGDRINGGSGEDNAYLPGLNHAASLASLNSVIEEVPASSHYGPDTTVNAVHADLAKKSAIFMIAQYCWDICKMILFKWCSKNESDRWNPRVCTKINTIGANILFSNK